MADLLQEKKKGLYDEYRLKGKEAYTDEFGKPLFQADQMIGGQNEVDTVKNYYEQQGVTLTEEEMAELSAYNIPEPQFQMVSEKEYSDKSSCGRRTYRNNLKKYKKSREKYWNKVEKGQMVSNRDKYAETLRKIEFRIEKESDHGSVDDDEKAQLLNAKEEYEKQRTETMDRYVEQDMNQAKEDNKSVTGYVCRDELSELLPWLETEQEKKKSENKKMIAPPALYMECARNIEGEREGSIENNYTTNLAGSLSLVMEKDLNKLKYGAGVSPEELRQNYATLRGMCALRKLLLQSRNVKEEAQAFAASFGVSYGAAMTKLDICDEMLKDYESRMTTGKKLLSDDFDADAEVLKRRAIEKKASINMFKDYLSLLETDVSKVFKEEEFFEENKRKGISNEDFAHEYSKNEIYLTVEDYFANEDYLKKFFGKIDEMDYDKIIEAPLRFRDVIAGMEDYQLQNIILFVKDLSADERISAEDREGLNNCLKDITEKKKDVLKDHVKKARVAEMTDRLAEIKDDPAFSEKTRTLLNKLFEKLGDTLTGYYTGSAQGDDIDEATEIFGESFGGAEQVILDINEHNSQISIDLKHTSVSVSK